MSRLTSETALINLKINTLCETYETIIIKYINNNKALNPPTSINLMSAGTLSPTLMYTISPGTRYLANISCTTPFLMLQKKTHNHSVCELTTPTNYISEVSAE